MFRPKSRILIASSALFAVLGALAGIGLGGVVLAAPAQAGQHGHHSGSHGFAGRYWRRHHAGGPAFARLRHGRHERAGAGPRIYSRTVTTNARHGHSAASSGAMLAGGAPHRDDGIRHWRGHGGTFDMRRFTTRFHRHPYHGGAYYGGNVAIVIGKAGQGATSDTTASDGVILENGSCAPDTYCTLRLGPYANSPKIITLNQTGKTLTSAGFK